MRYKCKRHEQFNFDPKHAALIVIDMQGYFTSKSSHAYVPGTPKIIKNINKLVAEFYEVNRPVVFTRHIDVDKKNLMCRWWRERIDKKDSLSKIDERLDAAKGKVIVKHSYDAFFGTSLEKFLKRKKIKHLVITGVVTHLCCETTARSAFIRNFVPYIVIDATGAHKISHHHASIFNLARGFAVPVKTSELLK